MKTIKFAACIAVSVLACSAAYAGEDQSFSALQGVEAQALSTPEMSSVYGQYSLLQLKAAVDATLANYPKLDAAVNTAIDTHPVLTNAIVTFLTNHGY